ncbi:MAG: hypothetical protein WCG52_10880, partial [bacterium]
FLPKRVRSEQGTGFFDGMAGIVAQRKSMQHEALPRLLKQLHLRWVAYEAKETAEMLRMKTKGILRAVALAVLLACPSCSPTPQSRQQGLEKALNESRQEFFDAIHPVGTAKSVKINSLNSKPPFLDVRMTIFWEGPIIKDGYTKIAFRYDSEVRRIVGLKVEGTNGMTKEDVGFAAGTILSALLKKN